MGNLFKLRLSLDLVALLLFFVALAYSWLDNAAHEWIGLTILILVGTHNVFNRRWYLRVGKGPRNVRSLTEWMMTLALLIAVVTMLVTSLAISQTVLPAIALEEGFTARRMHALAAYWVLVFVAVHLGLRWQIVMNAMHSTLRIAAPNAARTILLRVVALALALHGIRSSFALSMGTKLTAQLSSA